MITSNCYAPAKINNNRHQFDKHNFQAKQLIRQKLDYSKFIDTQHSNNRQHDIQHGQNFFIRFAQKLGNDVITDHK
jgi:hypothetical protein